MDVKKILVALDFCDQHCGDCFGISEQCPEQTDFEDEHAENCIEQFAYNTPEEVRNALVEIRDHYQALLKTERSKVIAEVSAEISKQVTEDNRTVFSAGEIYIILDSMADKEDDNV